MTNETGSELKNLIIKLTQLISLPNDTTSIGIEPVKIVHNLYKSIIEKFKHRTWHEPSIWMSARKAYEIRFSDPNPKLYDMTDIGKSYEPIFDESIYVMFYENKQANLSFFPGWDAYVLKTEKTFKANINCIFRAASVVYREFETDRCLVETLNKASSTIVGLVPNVIDRYNGRAYIACNLIPFITQNVNKFDLYCALFSTCTDLSGSRSGKYYIFCEPIKLSGPDETEKIKNLCNLGVMALIEKSDGKM